MQIPENYILAADAEREYGLYAGAIRQHITRLKTINQDECMKVAGAWFVSRNAVERIIKKGDVDMSTVKINPFYAYYYSLSENKHYTEDEYGKLILERTGGSLDEAAFAAVRKRMKSIQYVKDNAGNSYIWKNDQWTKIEFEDQSKLQDLYKYQKKELRSAEHEAMQDSLPKQKQKHT